MPSDAGVGLADLRVAVAAIGDAPADSYDRPVAGCPGWVVTDVITHVGQVHRWVVAALNAPPGERVRFPAAPGLGGVELRDWYRTGAAALIDCFATTDLDREVWTFAGPQPARWWQRRQVHENAVHAWDVQAALGRPEPLPLPVAVDGIDEYVEVFLPRLDVAAFGGAGETMLVQATDAPDAWRVTFDPEAVVVDRLDRDDAGAGAASATSVLAGSASDLCLFVWSRVAPADLDRQGDPELPARFQAASSI